MNPPEIICRTCCQPQQPGAMFVSVVRYGTGGVSISDMIYQITDIMVTLDPHLPQHLCPGCAKTVKLAYNFRQMAISSNTALLNRQQQLQEHQQPSVESNLNVVPHLVMVKEESVDWNLQAEEADLYGMAEEAEDEEEPLAKKTKRRNGPKRRSVRDTVRELCLERIGGKDYCVIDRLSGCQYASANVDLGYFISHCRKEHPAAAQALGLFDENRIEADRTDDEPEVGTDLTPEITLTTQSGTHQTGTSKQTKGKKRNFRCIAHECMEDVGDRYICIIDPYTKCAYSQQHLDMGNFIRHLRVQHPKEAFERGLMRNKPKTNASPSVQKKQAAVSIKMPAPNSDVAMRVHALIESCIKLVAIHRLPADCFEWDGFHSIFKMLAGPLNIDINSELVTKAVSLVVDRISTGVRLELQRRLVSILIESAVRRGQHYLTMSAQFGQHRHIQTRMLGVLRVGPDESIELLKARICAVLKRYELDDSQIYGIVVENGTNMLLLDDQLPKSFPRAIDLDFGKDTDGSELAKTDRYLESLCALLREQFSVMRGPLRDLHHALNEIVPDDDPAFGRISKFTRDLRDSRYEKVFTAHSAPYPLTNTDHRWSAKFKTIQTLYNGKRFLRQLVLDHPELDFDESDWQYVTDFREAFRPLHGFAYRLTQSKNYIFSDFYMQWLMVIRELRRNAQFASNRFLKPLAEALTRRIGDLRQSVPFGAGMLLDPRFNYLESVVFTGEQRDEMKNYILNIWNRINALKPDSEASQLGADSVKQEVKKEDDMDDFLSEMFGGPSEGSSKASVPLNSAVTPVLQQLKGLEIEPRQPHDYDVWNHWLQRTDSHAELFSVAMVVMSLPSNNICLERSYSALVLGDRGDGLTEQTLDELLMVRLNRTLFEKSIPTMYDWKKLTQPQD